MRLESGAESGGEPRLTFANQLRGLAIVSVVISHFIGIYWTKRDVVASHIWAPLLQGEAPRLVGFVVHDYFNFGQFGVGLFFLISGFVIPFSVDRLGSKRFLLARFFRIYPTYVFAFLLALGVVWLSAQYWHVAFHEEGRVVLHNVLLVNRMTALDSLDLVNWTLQIEVKFYLSIAFLFWMFKRIPPLALLAASLLVLAFNYFLPPDTTLHLRWFDFSASMFGVELMFMVFMFIGVAFHCLFRKTMSPAIFAATVAILLGAFTLSWKYSLISYQFYGMTLDYFYALFVFGLCYALRHHFVKRWPLDRMADISYPLYIIHSLMGYAGIRFLGSLGVPYLLAAPLMFVLLCLLAYVLHISVELPTYLFGKRLAQRMHRRHARTIETAEQNV